MAGPLANVVVAIACLALMQWTRYSFQFGPRGVQPLSDAHKLLEMAVLINALLAMFNLLPIPPLDGSHIWPCVIPGLKPMGSQDELARAGGLDRAVVVARLVAAHGWRGNARRSVLAPERCATGRGPLFGGGSDCLQVQGLERGRAAGHRGAGDRYSLHPGLLRPGGDASRANALGGGLGRHRPGHCPGPTPIADLHGCRAVILRGLGRPADAAGDEAKARALGKKKAAD